MDCTGWKFPLDMSMERAYHSLSWSSMNVLGVSHPKVKASAYSSQSITDNLLYTSYTTSPLASKFQP